MDCRTQARALADMQTKPRLKYFTGVARISTTCSSGHPSWRNASAVASSPVRSRLRRPAVPPGPRHRISHRRVAHRPEAEQARDRRQPAVPAARRAGRTGSARPRQGPAGPAVPWSPLPVTRTQPRPISTSATRSPSTPAERSPDSSISPAAGPSRCGSSTPAGGNPVQAGDAWAVSAPWSAHGPGADALAGEDLLGHGDLLSGGGQVGGWGVPAAAVAGPGLPGDLQAAGEAVAGAGRSSYRRTRRPRWRPGSPAGGPGAGLGACAGEPRRDLGRAGQLQPLARGDHARAGVPGRVPAGAGRDRGPGVAWPDGVVGRGRGALRRGAAKP